MAQALLKKESASQEVTHKIQKLRYVPLAFAARSETIAFFCTAKNGLRLRERRYLREERDRR